MSADGGIRRILPPPRRQPGLLAILIRWRAELTLGGSVAAVWCYGGDVVIGIGALTLGVLVAFVPPIRGAVAGAVRSIVVPHRVRSGLVQAGVADRSGRLPWIVMARPHGLGVWVYVWLRSGTTVGDLRGAVSMIASASGATHVEIVQRSPRQDRAIVIVVRPRWGLFGK